MIETLRQSNSKVFIDKIERGFLQKIGCATDKKFKQLKHIIIFIKKGLEPKKFVRSFVSGDFGGCQKLLRFSELTFEGSCPQSPLVHRTFER
jgi:hypothetical protein